jgi:hydrogenase/urease accessory protein HupE
MWFFATRCYLYYTVQYLHLPTSKAIVFGILLGIRSLVSLYAVEVEVVGLGGDLRFFGTGKAWSWTTKQLRFFVGFIFIPTTLRTSKAIAFGILLA